MSESKTIARPYANACFEVAQDGGSAGEWLLFLETAAEVVKDEAMLDLVKSPGIDKQALAKTIFTIANEASDVSESDERMNFVSLLANSETKFILSSDSETSDASLAIVKIVLASACLSMPGDLTRSNIASSFTTSAAVSRNNNHSPALPPS